MTTLTSIDHHRVDHQFATSGKFICVIEWCYISILCQSFLSVHSYACMYVHVCMYECMYVCMYVYIYIYKYLPIYI